MAQKTSLASGQTSFDITTKGANLWGWTFTNDGGATATVELRESGADTNPLIARVLLSTSVLTNPNSFPDPIKCPNGIRVVRSGANSTVSVYWDG